MMVIMIVITPSLPEIANLSMKYFILSKVYTVEGVHGLSACVGDNPRAFIPQFVRL